MGKTRVLKTVTRNGKTYQQHYHVNANVKPAAKPLKSTPGKTGNKKTEETNLDRLQREHLEDRVYKMLGDDIMSVGDITDALKQIPKKTVFPIGFTNPHSYRGWYDQPAVTFTRNVTAGEMLKTFKALSSQEFIGWKGGRFTYTPDQYVNIAAEGTCNDDDPVITAEGFSDMCKLAGIQNPNG